MTEGAVHADNLRVGLGLIGAASDRFFPTEISGGLWRLSRRKLGRSIVARSGIGAARSRSALALSSEEDYCERNSRNGH
jgi:hypothetical protein